MHLQSSNWQLNMCTLNHATVWLSPTQVWRIGIVTTWWRRDDSNNDCREVCENAENVNFRDTVKTYPQSQHADAVQVSCFPHFFISAKRIGCGKPQASCRCKHLAFHLIAKRNVRARRSRNWKTSTGGTLRNNFRDFGAFASFKNKTKAKTKLTVVMNWLSAKSTRESSVRKILLGWTAPWLVPAPCKASRAFSTDLNTCTVHWNIKKKKASIYDFPQNIERKKKSTCVRLPPQRRRFSRLQKTSYSWRKASVCTLGICSG